MRKPILVALFFLALPVIGRAQTSISLKPYKWSHYGFIAGQPAPLMSAPYKTPGPALTIDFSQTHTPDPNSPGPWDAYLIRPYGFPISGSTIVADVNISTGGNLTFDYISEPFNTCQFPAHTRFYVQLDGQSNGRWWSSASYQLAQGGTMISVPIDPADWTDVNGLPGTDDTADFWATFNAGSGVTWFGFTFGGGCFFSHGINVYGAPASFNVTRFEID